MPSKSTFEALRKGEAIEWEPGVYARVNPKTRKLETSSGKNLEIPADLRAELFPTEESLPLVESRERVQSQVADSSLGEFGHQFFNQGIPGAVKDWYNYVTKSGEDYISQKAAENYESQLISEQSPWMSAGATGANVGLDLLLTRGMSGASAAPLLIGASAGPEILERPLEVAGEAALGAGIGRILDAGGNFIGEIAARRAASREVAQEAPLIRQINEREAQRVALGNAEQNIAFREARGEVNARNLQALNQHKNDLAKWKSDIASAEANHAKALAEFQMAQKKMKADYSSEVIRNAEKIAGKFPEGQKISLGSFKVSQWIEDEIERSGLGTLGEGKKAANIIKNIFPENQSMTPVQLSKAYKSLENHILNSEPAVSNLLVKWKDHLADRMPKVLGDVIAYKKIAQGMERDIINSIDKSLKDVSFKGHLLSRPSEISRKLKNDIKDFFQSLGYEDFSELIRSGKLMEDIKTKLITPKDFLYKLPDVRQMKQIEKGIRSRDDFFADADRVYGEFIRNLDGLMEKKLSKYSIDAGISVDEAYSRLERYPSNTRGMSPDSIAPNAPEFPVKPIRPDKIAMPNPPIPEVYNPIPEPILPEATNMVERIGDSFERPLLRGDMTNNLMKLGFLKYLGGPMTHAAEAVGAAGYLGARALTNPNIPGQAISQVGGLGAIDAMAKKYYSYHNGILDDPAERRSLTREIEDDPNMSLEDKAILQSKVNRGKSIFSPTV